MATAMERAIDMAVEMIAEVEISRSMMEDIEMMI